MCNPGERRWSKLVPKPKTEMETEVVAASQNDRRQRRNFTPEYKERILREADACTERGALGTLLRREGLYSSQLSDWRAHRTAEGQAGLQPKRPGPKPTHDAKDSLIEKQNARIEKLEKELLISRALLELQGKAQEILGLALPRVDDNSTDSSSISSERAPKKSR
jgi:transposase